MIRALQFGLLAVLVSVAPVAYATWAEPDETVPLERVVENVKAFLKEHPDNAHGYYILGRAYSLAYAVEMKEFGLYKARTSGDHLYPPMILDTFEKKVPDEQTARKNLDLLEQSAQYYAQGVALLQPDEPIGPQLWLAYGWTAEEASKYAEDVALPAIPGAETKPLTDKQRNALDSLSSDNAGKAKAALEGVAAAAPELRRLAKEGSEKARAAARELLKREWEATALSAYRRVFRTQMESVRQYKHYNVLAAEAGEGITSILNKRPHTTKEERKELGSIASDLKAMRKYPQAVTPLVFPLQPGQRLADILDMRASVPFDLDGFKRGVNWPWVTRDAALLAWDPRRTGRIESGRQLIGSVTWWFFWENGFQVLACLDDNRDGWLKGTELQGLAVWVDVDEDACSDQGELIPIEAFGVDSLAASPQGRLEGTLFHPAGVKLRDGRVLPLYDWEPESR